MDPEIDLQTLMARYQQGNGAAAAELVQRLSPQLHRFFLMQVASRRHADDLLQETWLRIHQARHTYRSDQPLLPWLYAIARNIRVDHFRRAHRTEFREQQLDEAAPLAGPPPAGSREGELEALIEALPESQREVITMLKVVGMSLEEVARATSSSIGAVKQKAHRAYETLRKGFSGSGMAGARTGERS